MYISEYSSLPWPVSGRASVQSPPPMETSYGGKSTTIIIFLKCYSEI